MSQKLKVILGVLLLVAGFLIVRLGLFFKNSVTTAGSALVKGVSQPNNAENFALKDSDNDGIADYDEAYYRTNPSSPDTDGDGYLDGEEIVSGFNPTRADTLKQGSSPNNVTATLSERLVSGIYAGDLNPRNGMGDKYTAGMNYLALATIDEALNKINQTSTNNTVLTTNNSTESQEEYLKNIANILEGPFLDAFLDQPQALNRALNAALLGHSTEANETFAKYQLLFTEAYTRLLAIPAPENWADFHRNLLLFFQKIATGYRYATQLDEDPLLALTALSELTQSIANTDSYVIQDLRTLLRANSLKVPNSTLFEVLGLLNST